MKKIILSAALLLSVVSIFSQSDSAQLEKLRTESGVDPTRVQTRAGYTFLAFDQDGDAGMAINRVAMTFGVNRWSFSAKYEGGAFTTGIPGTGFKSGFGDIKFSILNAFYVSGKTALAASAEFSIPTGKVPIGIPYFSATPSITYSYTINQSLFLAVQPQYTFALLKDPAFPELSVLTIRSFLAKFTKSGYFFVFEPRPIFDFGVNKTDFVISPIIGKSLGGGFNLITLAEFPLTNNIRSNRGTVYQFGFNKNF